MIFTTSVHKNIALRERIPSIGLRGGCPVESFFGGIFRLIYSEEKWKN